MISFRGLPDLVVAELLFGTQQRLDRHVRLLHTAFKALCDMARAQQVTSLNQLTVEANTRMAGVWKSMTADIRVGLATPELEQLKDVWDAEVFGLGKGRTMNFTGLSQEWLRRAAKAWVLDAIPRRYGRNIPNSLMSMVVCLERLSDSLRINREDHGDAPERLRRTDVEVFQQRLAYLEHTGQISPNLRVTICRWCARFLREIREMGLTRPRQMLAGLPDDFSFCKGHATIGALAPSPWLFPGGQPGRPISTTQLTQRLNQLGIRPNQARSTALFQLAAEIPAAILARTPLAHTLWTMTRILLPAPAGMVPGNRALLLRARTAPRTRGDGPGRICGRSAAPSCSPHPRGWSLHRCPGGRNDRLLPAPARMVPGRSPAGHLRPAAPRTRVGQFRRWFPSA
ncbi:hypothetical protein ACFCZT_17080 [Streptomyces sp. NPDC056230]|uniref:hypothetical protein n=1 Tax=unclassified Streptomyces TaxID=2593676 RepID=UPI0035E2F498